MIARGWWSVTNMKQGWADHCNIHHFLTERRNSHLPDCTRGRNADKNKWKCFLCDFCCQYGVIKGSGWKGGFYKCIDCQMLLYRMKKYRVSSTVMSIGSVKIFWKSAWSKIWLTTFHAVCAQVRAIFACLDIFSSQKCMLCHIFVMEWNIQTTLQTHIPKNWEIFW